MKLFGLEITRSKAAGLQAVDTSSQRGWLTIYEGYSGAWQHGDTVTLENVLTHPTVYACVTLIASDIPKMRLRLVEHVGNDVWRETDSPAFSPVLRQANHYQTTQQLLEQWLLSLLTQGNAYVLKERDARGVVVALYVLDATRVRPLVAPNGDVFYELRKDELSGLSFDRLAVPAAEIIHDRMAPLYHPLVGIAPVQAAWLAAKQGLSIQASSSHFHANGAMPGGVLTVPGSISQTLAETLKANWETNFGGDNYGKVAILADGMRFEPLAPMKAADAQAVEQLKWGDEKVCSVYHVPAYMVGVGPQPAYNNVEALNRQYYSQCLGARAVAIENLLDIGLGLWPQTINGRRLGVEFNKDDLWQMDTATLIASEDSAKQIKTPNESRARLNLPPVVGGDTVYRQEQDHSLEALSRRDAREDPFMSAPGPEPVMAPEDTSAEMPPPKALADLSQAGAQFVRAYDAFEKARVA